MFLDKVEIGAITNPDYRHMMSLVYFAAVHRASGLKYNNWSKFLRFLFSGSFESSEKCTMMASLKLYQFHAYEDGDVRVAMYLVPMSDTEIGNVSAAPSRESDRQLSFMVYYSLNKADSRRMLLREDYYELYNALHDISHLDGLVSGLEKYKLLNA